MFYDFSFRVKDNHLAVVTQHRTRCNAVQFIRGKVEPDKCPPCNGFYGKAILVSQLRMNIGTVIQCMYFYIRFKAFNPLVCFTVPSNCYRITFKRFIQLRCSVYRIFASRRYKQSRQNKKVEYFSLHNHSFASVRAVYKLPFEQILVLRKYLPFKR